MTYITDSAALTDLVTMRNEGRIDDPGFLLALQLNPIQLRNVAAAQSLPAAAFHKIELSDLLKPDPYYPEPIVDPIQLTAPATPPLFVAFRLISRHYPSALIVALVAAFASYGTFRFIETVLKIFVH